MRSQVLALLPFINKFKGSFITGVSWMTAGTVITRGGSLAAQLALALLLTKEDFGVYAIVISIFVVSNALRDAGAEALLTQRGADTFDQLAPPVFWAALFFNLMISAGLMIFAPVAAWLYGDSRITPLLIILAVSVPLRTPVTILLTKLSIDLRFSALSTITTASFLVKFAVWVALAWLGFGPFSFVLPLPFIIMLEGLWAYRLAKVKLWRSGLQVSRWPSIFRSSRWIIISQATTALLQNGDYLVLGLLLPTGIVGVYYFAYELVAQVGSLLGNNIFKVLFPSLSNLKHQPEQQRTQLKHALNVMTMLAPVMGMLIAVGIAPLVQLTGWQARFPGIVAVVRNLAFFISLRILVIITRSALMTLGRFRTVALIIGTQGLGLMLVAFLAAWLGLDIGGIALLIGLYLGFTSLIFAGYALTQFNISWLYTLRVTLLPWLLGVGLALAAIEVDGLLVGYISTLSSDTLAALIRIIVSTSLFLLLFGLGLYLAAQLRRSFRSSLSPT